MSYYYKIYDPNVDFVTLAILVVFFFIFTSTFYSNSKKNNIFKRAIIVLFLATLVNVTYMMMVTKWGVNNHLLIYILRDIADCMLLATLCIYIRYLCLMFESSEKHRKFLSYFCIISLTIFNSLIVLSPITHFGFYLDANNNAHGSFFMEPFAIGYMCYLLTLSIQMLKYRKAMHNRTFKILMVAYIAVLVIMYQEATIESTSFLCFTYILPLLMVFSLFHSTSYDIENGTLDVQAFDDCLADLYKNKKDFGMMSLTLVDKSDLSDFYKNVRKELYYFYEKYFVKAFVFKVDDKRFILIYRKTKFRSVEEGLQAFGKEFESLYDQFHINFKMVHLKSNPVLENNKNYLKYIKYLESKTQVNDFYQETDMDLMLFLEQIKIMNLLKDISEKNDLNDERVLVYAQPIYNAKTKHILSAESLMRIKDNEGNIIYPDKFIPIAEEYGYIHSLSMIILNKVCKELYAMTKEGYQINRISVNLSITELNDTTICSEIKKIIKANKIKYDMIGFELTESQDITNSRIVLKNVEAINKMGCKIYLDDFGTGYSNFDRIMQLPFDIIKFDKSLLDNSLTNKRFMLMTKNLAKTYSDLGYRILFEGVEREKDVKLCIKELYANYLQGYYYSKPVEIENLREFLKKEKKR